MLKPSIHPQHNTGGILMGIHLLLLLEAILTIRSLCFSLSMVMNFPSKTKNREQQLFVLCWHYAKFSFYCFGIFFHICKLPKCTYVCINNFPFFPLSPHSWIWKLWLRVWRNTDHSLPRCRARQPHSFREAWEVCLQWEPFQQVRTCPGDNPSPKLDNNTILDNLDYWITSDSQNKGLP